MTYAQAHRQLHRARGAAKDHMCRHCGLPAAHWAYDQSDRAAIVDAQGRTFSWDVDHYLALCVRCHYTLDLPDHVTWTLAKVLDTTCRTCGATAGRLCRSRTGTEYTSLSFQHARRKNDAPVDTRAFWMIQQEKRAAPKPSSD